MDKSSIESYSTFDDFLPHFLFLAILGYTRIFHEKISAKIKCFQNIYRHVVVFITVVYNIQLIIFVIQQRDNTELLVDSLFMLITILVTLPKHLVFNYADGIQEIVDIIKDSKFAPTHEYHVHLLKEDASKLYKMLIAFVLAVESSCIFYPIYHYLNRNQFGITSYFPFDTSQSPVFEITSIYLTIILSTIGMGNAAMDITLIGFYSHAKVQLRILRFNLEHLTDSEELTEIEDVNTGWFEFYQDITDEAYRKLVQSRVIKCVEHYKHITRFMGKFGTVFGVTLTIQVLACSWVNCITLYKAVGLSIFSTEFISMFVFLSCIVFELYIYCYHGTQVEYESQFMNQSLYFSNWLVLSPKLRKQLLIMTYCYCRPIQPTIAYVVPLSLNTFISVLKASYSLLTILRT